MLANGGEYGVGDSLFNTLRTIATTVHGGTVAGCGHFIIEECPELVIRDLEAFLK